MTPVFADTSYFAALLHERDQNHQRAKRISAELEANVITTEYVIVELGSLARRRPTRQRLAGFIQFLRSSERTVIVPASTELLEGGLALFAERPDKEWSLTDCISFFVMRRRGIVDALTSDVHFVQAGYWALIGS